MSTPIKDGGPAFPVVHAIVAQPGHYTSTPPAIPGMSLRDYFAGQAIQAYITMSVENARVGKMFDTKTLALGCYQFADAMIAEREKAAE